MRLICLLLFLASLALTTACTDRHTALPGEAFPSLAEDGAWCWFSDPRGVYYEGKYRRTYTGWVDSTGSIVVAQYDHDTQETKTHNLHPRLQKDDHNNPTIFVDDDGRIVVYYTRHSSRTPIFRVRSTNPEDISLWEATRSLKLNDTIAYAGLNNTYTYTHITRLRDEKDKLFLFWRGADFKPNVSVSSDGGNRWETGRILILPERSYRNRRPYLKVATNNKNAVHFAFTDGHPNAEPTNSVYYMQYREGALYRASGDKIINWADLPVAPDMTDKVYDATTTGDKAWIWDVAADSDNNPVLVFATFSSDSLHVYHYARYENGAWHRYRLAEAGSWFPHTAEGATEREPYYSGGMALDHSDPSTVYLSREKNGVFEIERWHTADRGKTWAQEAITQNSLRDNVRPFVVRHHRSEGPRLLWMNLHRYAGYTDYHAEIKYW